MNIKELAIAYDKYLCGCPAEEWKNYDSNLGTRVEQLRHCRWMCQQIIAGMGDERWICFVQGVMFCHTGYTINMMRVDNRAKPEIRIRVFRYLSEMDTDMLETPDPEQKIIRITKRIDLAVLDFLNDIGKDKIVSVFENGKYVNVYYWR